MLCETHHTAPVMTDDLNANLPEVLAACVRVLDDRKAEKLTVLDVRGLSTLTDFLVIATGNSDPHLRALVGATERELKNMHADVLGSEYYPGSGWAVVDAFDVMIHVFKQEDRDNYDLESFWKTAPRLPVGQWLSAPKA